MIILKQADIEASTKPKKKIVESFMLFHKQTNDTNEEKRKNQKWKHWIHQTKHYVIWIAFCQMIDVRFVKWRIMYGIPHVHKSIINGIVHKVRHIKSSGNNTSLLLLLLLLSSLIIICPVSQSVLNVDIAQPAVVKQN